MVAPNEDKNIQELVVKCRTPEINENVINPIKTRFSPRDFLPNPIPEKDIKVIFEAAHWAPSARNYQPWYFFWTDKNSKSWEVVQESVPDKHYWVRSAPTIIVCCYENLSPDDGLENKWAKYDLGASVISMVYQAQSMGYYCRQVGNFEPEKLQKTLKIPKSLTPFILLTMGKIGDYKNTSEDVIQKDLQPTGRKTKIWQRI